MLKSPNAVKSSPAQHALQLFLRALIALSDGAVTIEQTQLPVQRLRHDSPGKSYKASLVLRPLQSILLSCLYSMPTQDFKLDEKHLRVGGYL